MKLSDRDRRALLLLAAAGVVSAGIALWPEGGGADVEAVATVPQAERRVQSLRRIAAGLPAREEVRKKVAAELEAREKGLIQADTAAQAQAQMLQVVRRVLRQQQPPVDFRASEMGQPRPFGEFYGEVTATISLDCGIEQLVNLLADLGNQPELITTRELQFSGVTSAQKLVPTRITVSALVDRKLAPVRKEGQAF